MNISLKINKFLESSSWIRKMFEEGALLKQKYGKENVFDFSLGNPNLEPPEKFKTVIKELIDDPTPMMHSYMPNAGYPFVRKEIADYLNRTEGLNLNENCIVMCCGAGGGLNVVLHAITNPGEDILTISPFFVEYKFYADYVGANLKLVESNEDFSLNYENLENAITEKTKAIIINSPNNPTGRIYYQEEIDKLVEILEKKNKEYSKEIYLISDEPYKKLVYDDIEIPSILKSYQHAIVVYSFSKDLSLAGERIGYIAVNPDIKDYNNLMGALIFCNRTLGFVSAPGLMQRAVAKLLDEKVDINFYKRNRDTLYEIMTSAGFKFKKPEGAFYFFPKTPIEDDVEFIRTAQKFKLLLVPGSGFGRKSHFRVAYCVDYNTIVNSEKAWHELGKYYGLI
jgi:aspartate aminotransferase